MDTANIPGEEIALRLAHMAGFLPSSYQNNTNIMNFNNDELKQTVSDYVADQTTHEKLLEEYNRGRTTPRSIIVGNKEFKKPYNLGDSIFNTPFHNNISSLKSLQFDTTEEDESNNELGVLDSPDFSGEELIDSCEKLLEDESVSFNRRNLDLLNVKPWFPSSFVEVKME